MMRATTWIAAFAIVAGAVPFLWKALWLDLPILPGVVGSVWHVELEVDIIASDGRGSVTAAIPRSDAFQTIFDERVSTGGLEYATREDAGGRIGVWTGALQGVKRVSHAFRVQLHSRARDPERVGTPDPPIEWDQRLSPQLESPLAEPALFDILDRLDVAPDDLADATVRTIFGFVADEIETVEGSDDALLTLTAREGTARGKARLLTSLLIGAGVPARVSTGLRLGSPARERELVFAEALVDGRWLPLFPTLGLLDTNPKDLLVLKRGAGPLVTASGADAFAYRYRRLRERLRPEELATFMKPPVPVLEALSLYRLPVATQGALRLLLAIPLACLIIATFRNLIGLRTFGTFLPILISLALRDSGLVTGIAMVVSVLGAGVAGRLLLDRLHLLFVPRVCILLCFVILCIAGLALLGYQFEAGDLLSGVLLPIVILAMLIERFSITTIEEGFGSATTLLFGSAVVTIFSYPVFQSEAVGLLFFGYPELVLCVVGLLIGIGSYSGYRLLELFRFRSLTTPPAST